MVGFRICWLYGYILTWTLPFHLPGAMQNQIPKNGFEIFSIQTMNISLQCPWHAFVFRVKITWTEFCRIRMQRYSDCAWPKQKGSSVCIPPHGKDNRKQKKTKLLNKVKVLTWKRTSVCECVKTWALSQSPHSQSKCG